jgi:uncharacterized protein (TIRG00374 family)
VTGVLVARSRRRRALGLAVTAVALVAVAPTLVSVYSEAGTTFRLPARWLLAIVCAAFLQFLSMWTLQRIVLRTDRWLDVATPELVGNACSHLLPAGNAAGAGIQVRLLTEAGFPLTSALTALGATGLLSAAAGYVVLPFVVFVATAAGSDVDGRLLAAMWGGAVVLALLLVALVLIVRRDRPWKFVAGVITRFETRLHRPTDRADLERRLLAERDLVSDALRRRGATVAIVVVARPMCDFFCLLAALRAAGADINPAAALAAFIVSNVAGMIPLTPGGVGFVEAGLAATITLAGAADGPARVAVATYRLMETWLPCLAGLAAYPVFRRRHRRSTAAVDFRRDPPDLSITADPDRPSPVPGGPAGREEPTCPPTLP